MAASCVRTPRARSTHTHTFHHHLTLTHHTHAHANIHARNSLGWVGGGGDTDWSKNDEKLPPVVDDTGDASRKQVGPLPRKNHRFCNYCDTTQP